MIEIKEEKPVKAIADEYKDKTYLESSATVKNLTAVLGNDLTQICVITDSVSGYSVAIIQRGMQVIVLSPTFRYEKKVPIIFSVYTSVVKTNDEESDHRKALRDARQASIRIFKQTIGNVALEVQNNRSYHFSPTKMLSHSPKVTHDKIEKVGADVIAELMEVFSDDYISLPDNNAVEKAMADAQRILSHKFKGSVYGNPDDLALSSKNKVPIGQIIADYNA